MDKITQTIRYRQALICYAKKYGVTCVQIDVKFVPQVCMIGQEKTTKWYQYTFIDEYSSNHFPMRPLNWKSPKQALDAFASSLPPL